MIGQVISQKLGLSLFNSGASTKSQLAKDVSSEEREAKGDGTLAAVEKVAISTAAIELSQNPIDGQPDWQRVKALAGQLSHTMDTLFLKAGIDTSQPIRINIHPYTGIPFVGEHPDKERIQTLLDETPDLLQQIKNVNTLASYSYQASQFSHGLSSSATALDLSALALFVNDVDNRTQSALEVYEQNSQIARLSIQYQQDVGVTLDAITSKKNRR